MIYILSIIGLAFIVAAVLTAVFFTHADSKVFMNRQRLHDRVMTGESKVKSLPNEELLSLLRFSISYRPFFDVYSLVLDELRRRRDKE